MEIVCCMLHSLIAYKPSYYQNVYEDDYKLRGGKNCVGIRAVCYKMLFRKLKDWGSLEDCVLKYTVFSNTRSNRSRTA